MPNANIKNIISLLIISALLFIVSCSSPEEKRAKSLARVVQLQAEGEMNAALKLLEELSQNYPDDSEILRQIGLIHEELGNYTEAAFYLNAAHNLSPNDSALLYQTYLANEKVDQSKTARTLLEAFSKANPAAMTNALWFRLGELHTQARKTDSALKAYLEGVKLTDEKPSAEIALAIGTLFKQLNNVPMAERWLEIAAQSDDPNALPALFGLLEIHLGAKNWEAAENCIVLLDEKFPGAVDASEWASARIELQKWRAAQEEMKAQLEKIAQSEQEILAAEETQTEQETKTAEEALPAEKVQTAEEAKTETAETSDAEAVIQKDTESSETSVKAQTVTDIANAEALASTPAGERTKEEKSEPSAELTEPNKQTEPAEPEIVFDPSIIIEPADPDADPDEPVDPEDPENQTVVDYSTNYQSSATQPEPISEPDTFSEPDELQEPVAANPDPSPLSFEELIAGAKAATSERNYEKAIQLYWDALGQTNKRADIWNALSKVYLMDGQAKNAATTALEATRQSPENISYLLDYLRVVQRVKKPADFIKELEIAYERFPRSPEITLSLARGYHKISGNNYAAGILYRRFIQMAPNHPLRPEAEAALARIR